MTDTFDRFPFYWEVKTILLLYLSLPQFEARAPIFYSPKSRATDKSLTTAGFDLRLQNLRGAVPRPKRVRHRREHRVRALRDPPIPPVALLGALGHRLRPAEQDSRGVVLLTLLEWHDGERRLLLAPPQPGSALAIGAGLFGGDWCALFLGCAGAIHRKTGDFEVHH